ncbi:hypothetical protein M405DRAFT_818352 [Rhizopogon salebrosus TDB-379]|nr:hypothetical protein M405DRAFT_818352 [Rhizopogon salebrosus TDB-379]
MTNGITSPSGPDRHCASSSSSQFLPPCTVSILLALRFAYRHYHPHSRPPLQRAPAHVTS